jgi:GTP cyclohydrolase I
MKITDSESNPGSKFIDNIETPLRSDAFDRSDDQKITVIRHHFSKIMEELGLDLEDKSLKDTPNRVARMYVKEIFSGLNPKNKPKTTVFDNSYQYEGMLIETDIEFISACEHHFLPMPGLAYVGYVPKDKLIGLSKLNRIVKYFAKRPQGQERLTRQIHAELRNILGTDDVIVLINAAHMCIAMRGVEDKSSRTTSIFYSGAFKAFQHRKEFLSLITLKGYAKN